MSVTHYLPQDVLERSVGGARRLRELLKRPGAAEADPQAVESVQNTVDGYIRQAVGQIYDLNAFDAAYFNVAVNGALPPNPPLSDMDRRAIRDTHGKAIGRYCAWLEGAENLATPQEVKDGFALAMEGLRGLAQRLKDAGMAQKPSSSRQYGYQQPRGPGEHKSTSIRGRFRGFT